MRMLLDTDGLYPTPMEMWWKGVIYAPMEHLWDVLDNTVTSMEAQLTGPAANILVPENV